MQALRTAGGIRLLEEGRARVLYVPRSGVSSRVVAGTRTGVLTRDRPRMHSAHRPGDVSTFPGRGETSRDVHEGPWRLWTASDA